MVLKVGLCYIISYIIYIKQYSVVLILSTFFFSIISNQSCNIEMYQKNVINSKLVSNAFKTPMKR